MNTVLVTGATGYVGSEVVRQLLARGKEVTALGRTYPSAECTFVQADLSNPAGLQRALQGRTFDCIMHIGSLPGDTGDPTQMVQVNIDGCQSMLEYARQAGVSRFVLASSISAYGWYPATEFHPPDYLPVDEQHPCRPQDMYSTTKRVQELLTMTYCRQYGLPATVLRLTAVVGPRGRGGGRGWRQFAEQLAGRKRVQVPHFSAEELCHYVDIRDVVRMFVVAGEHLQAPGQIFNCCGPAPTRGAELREIIQRLAPSIEVEFGFPWSMAQGGEIAFDMSKACKLLDFRPRYSMEESIGSIQEWVDAGGLKDTQADYSPYGSGVAKA